MKALRNTILVIMAFLAWLVIGISGRVRGDIAGRRTEVVEYAALLVLSLGYLQWCLARFLAPLDDLPASVRRDLVSKCRQDIRSGFFRGTVVAGYLCAAWYVLGLLGDPTHVSEVPNFLIGAVFLIAAGTMAYSRTLVRTLARDFVNRDRESQASTEAYPGRIEDAPTRNPPQ